MTHPAPPPGADEPAKPPDLPALLRVWRRDARRRRGWRCAWGLALLALLALSMSEAKVSPVEFVRRLPQLGEWLVRLWPPDLSELPSFLSALWETLAIAVVGTAFAAAAALPLAVCVARTTAPWPWLSPPLRALLNGLRAIDTAIFALLFVAVVGLGPFAGALGVAFHTTGSMAKLFAEVLEGIPQETIEAVEATGAGRVRTFAFAVLPEATPGLIGVGLYLWEYNVRSSVVLGIVGAGGIGYELLVSLKLLDFPRLAAILILILVMVSLIDALSAFLRKRLK